MNLRKIILTSLLVLTVFSNGCGEKMNKEKVQYGKINEIPGEIWQALSHKKIYFGHQSVGYNILEGVQDLMRENKQIVLNIVETDQPPAKGNGFLAHSPIGENFHPLTKIDDFNKKLNANFKGDLDIALYKFCWVDVNDQSNIEGLFNDYRKALAELKAKHPKTVFVHATVPLFEQKKTWKTMIKEFIGKKEIWEYNDNVMRNRINEAIRAEYEGKEPLFDIAKYESTAMDGSRKTFKVGDTIYYAMVPEYTTDGGHLNELGRKQVASRFLVILANAAQ